MPGIIFENFFFHFFFTHQSSEFLIRMRPNTNEAKSNQSGQSKFYNMPFVSERTCAGNAALASPPPLSSSMCFLMVFMSLMVAPFWDRVLVSAASSSNVMGGQGRGKRADPPPLERKNEIIDNAVRLFMFRARAVTGTHPHNL